MCYSSRVCNRFPQISLHILSRCVTVHGSHNVDVSDNVAYDHYGHCFFLEDGGEMGNKFDHNLGLGTKTVRLLCAYSLESA